MNKYDLAYMKMAVTLSELSKSWRKKVGCLIVSFNDKVPTIISDGINGTLPGHSNKCEDEKTGQTYDYVIHAEENALNKLGNNFKLSGCTAYVTFQPCENCASKLISSGISRVVYSMDYKSNLGTQKLENAGIEVVRISPKKLGIDTTYLDYTGYLRSLGFPDDIVNSIVKKCIETDKYIHYEVINYANDSK